MARRREIGWSQEEILLHDILKQLEQLTKVIAQLVPTTTTTTTLS